MIGRDCRCPGCGECNAARWYRTKRGSRARLERRVHAAMDVLAWLDEASRDDVTHSHGPGVSIGLKRAADALRSALETE